MKLRPLFPKETLGIRKVFGLVVMMAAVAAVAYLERSLGRDLDLRLLYFLIVLCGAILLPRLLALAVAVSVAIVSVGVSGLWLAWAWLPRSGRLLPRGRAAPITGAVAGWWLAPPIFGSFAAPRVLDIGDHWIVVGRVRALDLHRGEAEPLVFCRGGFGRQTPL